MTATYLAENIIMHGKLQWISVQLEPDILPTYVGALAIKNK